MKINQKGLSAVEVIIAIVIVGVIGAAGWMVYSRQHKAAAPAPVVLSDEAKAKAELVGYDTLPADLKPVLVAQIKKADAACAVDTSTPKLTGGGEVGKVIGDKFAKIQLRADDCNGSSVAYFENFGGGLGWDLAFRSQSGVSCYEVNRAKYTKELVPTCIADDTTTVRANTNP